MREDGCSIDGKLRSHFTRRAVLLGSGSLFALSGCLRDGEDPSSRENDPDNGSNDSDAESTPTPDDGTTQDDMDNDTNDSKTSDNYDDDETDEPDDSKEMDPVDPEDADVTVAISDEKVRSGEEVSLQISLTSHEHSVIFGYQFEIQFDADLLTFLGVEGGEFASPVVNEAHVDNGELRFNAIDTSGQSTPIEPVARIIFTAEDPGKATVSFVPSASEVVDDHRAFEVAYQDGTVDIDPS